MKKFSLVLLALLTAVAVIGCSDDKDSSKASKSSKSEASSSKEDAFDNWEDEATSAIESAEADIMDDLDKIADEFEEEAPAPEVLNTIEEFFNENPAYFDAFKASCDQTLQQYSTTYADITFEATGNEVIYSYYYLNEMDPSGGDQIIDGLSQQPDDVIFGDFQKLGSFDEIIVTFRYYQPSGDMMCEYSRSTN